MSIKILQLCLVLVSTEFDKFSLSSTNVKIEVTKHEAGHPDATELTRDFSPRNSDAMDILTLG